MRNLLFSVGIITGCFNFTLAAETRTAEQILGQKELLKARYILKTELLNVIVLNMPYGDNYVISELDKELLKKVEVQLIDLVFTDFPKGDKLRDLNLSRVRLVESLRGNLVSNQLIKWRIIRQTDCKNEGEAKTMFHGIVIHFKPLMTEEEKQRQIAIINSIIPEESKLSDPKKMRNSLSDSTVLKVMERNKDWNDITIVADFTGSMAPYTSQTVLWFKLKTNDHRVKNVAFFNDGNMIPDKDKKIGETGGIYFSEAKGYETIRKLAIQTISNGFGGDAAENNIEALLYALEHAPNTNDLVMVADNTAPVKDMDLLVKLNKPVHIILCGTRLGINTDYLTIARRTGGSVHTMEKDLVDLFKKNEGEVFEFMGEKFKIKAGKVVKLT